MSSMTNVVVSYPTVDMNNAESQFAKHWLTLPQNLSRLNEYDETVEINEAAKWCIQSLADTPTAQRDERGVTHGIPGGMFAWAREVNYLGEEDFIYWMGRFFLDLYKAGFEFGPQPGDRVVIMLESEHDEYVTLYNFGFAGDRHGLLVSKNKTTMSWMGYENLFDTPELFFEPK